eukprot:jgi/Astpho2/6933/Aster-01799
MAATLLRSVGSVLKGAGSALDSAGAALQGRYAYREALPLHQTLQAFAGKRPTLGEQTFVAPNASVIGDVTIGNRASVWYGAVLRGDVQSIKVGENTNIQDNVIIHVAKHNPKNNRLPTTIGSNVTIGHGATIHACTVEDGSLVGMGATVLDGATAYKTTAVAAGRHISCTALQVQKCSIVAAGSLVSPGTTVPTGEIWAGNPAKMLRKLDADEREFIKQSAANYALLADIHASENAKTSEEIEKDNDLRLDGRMRTADYDSHLGIVRDPVTREIVLTAKST